jgi:serine/threonine-protein kinase
VSVHQPETIGKYRIVEPIGRGGMGMIFKARDPILDRLVALKVISPEVEITDELRTRFFREAKACAKLNHPNIVTVHDMGEDAGRLFIVMELLQGDELRQIIKAGTPLTLEDKLWLIRQVCRGLHYAHQQGVIHRDMKPANIFVLRSGQAKILDFGIARFTTTDPGLTRTGLIMGTLRYISPEQVRGHADHRSDMFSVGAVLYELLTSRPPFLGDHPMQILEQLRSEDPPPPRDIDPTIPAELDAVVRRAMRKDPAERYRDLQEMGAALDRVQAAVGEQRSALGEREDQERQAAQRAPEPDQPTLLMPPAAPARPTDRAFVEAPAAGALAEVPAREDATVVADPAWRTTVPSARSEIAAPMPRRRWTRAVTVTVAAGVVVASVVLGVSWRLATSPPVTDSSRVGSGSTSPGNGTVSPPGNVSPPANGSPEARVSSPGSAPAGAAAPSGEASVAARTETKPPPPTVRRSVEDTLRSAGMLRGSRPDDTGVMIADVRADGRVTLVGVLKDGAAKRAAADLVRGVAGVTAVDVGRVTVTSGWETR